MTSCAKARQSLLESELVRVLDILIAEYQPEAVYLFGSLAGGTVSEWSDLDLVIIKDTDESFYDRIATVLKLTRPKVGTDICVYTPTEWTELKQQRQFVKQEIIRQGKLLYAA